jgi:ATP-dependent DNA ligase
MKVEICTGLNMPFFPMRPIKGQVLQRSFGIKQLYEEAVDDQMWVMQPKLNGDRVLLAVIDRTVFTQNRYGQFYRQKIGNARDFLKLPNHTCFDGEVFKGNFYPFEMLVCGGKNLLRTAVHERVQWARDMTKFIGHPWLFETPSLAWLMRRGANAPNYEGVVLKRTGSGYTLLGSPTQFTFDWLKRLW